MSNVQERLRAIARLQQPGARVIMDHKEVKPLVAQTRDPFDDAPPVPRRRGEQTPEGRLRLREMMLARRREPGYEARRLATFRATMALRRAAKGK